MNKIVSLLLDEIHCQVDMALSGLMPAIKIKRLFKSPFLPGEKISLYALTCHRSSAFGHGLCTPMC